jgi:hypothetical protein
LVLPLKVFLSLFFFLFLFLFIIINASKRITELSIGKIVLVEKRAFQDNVDVCLMLHPAAYDNQYAAMIAIHDVRVEFFGKPSHASGKERE